jgi:hypothetical protein
MFSAGLDHLIVPRAAFDDDTETLRVLLSFESKPFELESGRKAFVQAVDVPGCIQQGLHFPRLDFGQNLPDFVVDLQRGIEPMFLFHFHEPQAVNGGEGTMKVFSYLLVGQMFHRRMRCLLFQCSSYHIHGRFGSQRYPAPQGILRSLGGWPLLRD